MKILILFCWVICNPHLYNNCVDAICQAQNLVYAIGGNYAAKQASLGAGAKVIQVYSYELTKKDVAEAVGVHPSSIGNLEKGSIPQADLLYSLAKFFDVSMEYLMNSSDPEPLSEIEYTQSQLSSSELTLLNLFSQLDELDQNEIIGIINLKLLRYRHDASPKKLLSSISEETTKTKMA